MSAHESKEVFNLPGTHNQSSKTATSIVNPTFTGPRPNTNGLSDGTTQAKIRPLTSKESKQRKLHLQTGDKSSPVFLSPVQSLEALHRGETGNEDGPESRSQKSPVMPQDEDDEEDVNHYVAQSTAAAVLPLSHPISEVSVGQAGNRKVWAEDEKRKKDPTEKSPLISARVQSDPEPDYTHSQAYQKLGNIPANMDPEDPYSKLESQRHGRDDRERLIDHDDTWWSWACCRMKPDHPIPSRFTNEAFRQAYAGEILKVKSIQILLCFLVSVTAQFFWDWDWNQKMGTPAYVLRVEQHRWVVAIPLCLYLILVGFIRFVTPKECRSWPFNMVVHVGYTVLLCLLSFILSVGFGDVFFAGLVPVTLGSLYFAYLIFRRLVTADEDAKFKVDVSTPGFYYAIPTLISAGVIIFWPTIYFLLSITDSVAGAEDIGRSLLFEGIPAIPIGGTILLIEVYHIQQLFAGHLVSIITEDQSEVLFATFFI